MNIKFGQMPPYGDPWVRSLLPRLFVRFCIESSWCSILTLSLIAVSLEEGMSEAQVPPCPQFGDYASTPLDRQAIVDADKITVQQLNLFHGLIVKHCMPALPDAAKLQYSGLVGTDDGRHAQRIEKNLGDHTTWRVQRNVVLFSLVPTTRKMPGSAAKCKVGEQELFVNVPFVDKNRTIDAKLPDLGDQSIREVIALLDGKHTDDLSAGSPPPHLFDGYGLTPLDRQENADANIITVRQMNLFHDLIITQCMPALPEVVTLQYAGLAVNDNGREKQQAEKNLAHPLTWEFQADKVLFKFVLTTYKASGSLAKCRLEGQDRYVNASFVVDEQGVDAKLPALAYKSVREIAARLNGKISKRDE